MAALRGRGAESGVADTPWPILRGLPRQLLGLLVLSSWFLFSLLLVFYWFLGGCVGILWCLGLFGVLGLWGFGFVGFRVLGGFWVCKV